MASVTGAISSTVVTLSSRADTTAVTRLSRARIAQGLPRAAFADQMASAWNMPLRRAWATSSIMPMSSASVLKSSPAMARSWSITPARIITAPPIIATIARLTRSVMMMP